MLTGRRMAMMGDPIEAEDIELRGGRRRPGASICR